MFSKLLATLIDQMVGSKIYLRTPNLGLAESNELKVFKFLRKISIRGNIFLDIGSCYGFYALRLSKIFRKVVAIEPEENNFRILTMNIKLCRMHNVTPLHMAVSDSTGETSLFISNSVFTHSLKPEFASNSTKFQTVKTVCLDDFVKEPIDLVKLDVQGAVFDILKGAHSVVDDIKSWIIELEPEELYRKHELESTMWLFNYKTEWVSNQHLYASR